MGKSEENRERSAVSYQQLANSRAKFAPTGNMCYSKSNTCPPSVCQLVRASNGIVRNPTWAFPV